MPEIETARLLLRMFTADDLDDLSLIYADAEVMKYLSGHPLTREETASWLNYFPAGWEQYGFGWWGVIFKERGELIGHGGLQFIHVTPEVEVTYGLAREYWGMGLASEAARACLRYGFEELKLDRIYALADPPNVASHRVMARVGMTYEKTEYYKDDHYDGDLVYYAISRDEHRPDGSQYSLRPVPGDDVRISFCEAFEVRKREWMSATKTVQS
ncbi:MAG: GNAT family N-acetyltransferase [Acidobacteriota bacterium]